MKARTCNTPLRSGALLALVLLLPPGIASSGDEVDYSAPYLVVEDGKLVTKYPGRDHESKQGQGAPDAASQSAQAGDDSEFAGQRRGRAWLFAGGTLIVLIAGLALSMGRRP